MFPCFLRLDFRECFLYISPLFVVLFILLNLLLLLGGMLRFIKPFKEVFSASDKTWLE